MSKQRQDHRENRLPLPQPRSPQELDDKILTYARQRAAQKTNNWIPRWTSGWTTGLATASIVAIAVFITQTQQSAPSFDDKVQPTAARRYAEEAMVSKSKAPAAPATKKAVKQKMLSKRSVPKSYGLYARETVADMALAADTVAMPAADAMADELPRMDHQQVALKLEQSASLLKQGQEAQAREAYQALRQECPGCGLPETLDLWLASQQQDIAP